MDQGAVESQGQRHAKPSWRSPDQHDRFRVARLGIHGQSQQVHFPAQLDERCRIPSRASNRSSGRFKLKAKHIAPKASMHVSMSSITARSLGRSTNRSASGCCRSTRHDSEVWPKSAGRP